MNIDTNIYSIHGMKNDEINAMLKKYCHLLNIEKWAEKIPANDIGQEYYRLSSKFKEMIHTEFYNTKKNQYMSNMINDNIRKRAFEIDFLLGKKRYEDFYTDLLISGYIHSLINDNEKKYCSESALIKQLMDGKKSSTKIYQKWKSFYHTDQAKALGCYTEGDGKSRVMHRHPVAFHKFQYGVIEALCSRQAKIELNKDFLLRLGILDFKINNKAFWDELNKMKRNMNNTNALVFYENFTNKYKEVGGSQDDLEWIISQYLFKRFCPIDMTELYINSYDENDASEILKAKIEAAIEAAKFPTVTIRKSIFDILVTGNEYLDIQTMRRYTIQVLLCSFYILSGNVAKKKGLSLSDYFCQLLQYRYKEKDNVEQFEKNFKGNIKKEESYANSFLLLYYYEIANHKELFFGSKEFMDVISYCEDNMISLLLEQQLLELQENIEESTFYKWR